MVSISQFNSTKNHVLLVFPKLYADKIYAPGEVEQFPISALTLADCLMKDDVKVTILDGRVHEDDYEDILEELKEELLFVGISALTGQVSQGVPIAESVRSIMPEVPIVWGGWHATIFHESTIASDLVDVVARGEGEDTIRELAKAFQGRMQFGEIKGITYLEDDLVMVNPDRPIAAEFEEEVLPYDLVDPQHYEVVNNQLSMITSRGCPHDCTYCSIRTYYERRWYGNEATKVVNVIEQLRDKFQVTHFVFQDSNFFADPRRARSICEELIERDLGVTWQASGHINPLAVFFRNGGEILEQAGCVRLAMGVESGSQRMLDEMKKGLKVETLMEVAAYLDKTEIQLSCNFMMGLPGETEPDLLETFRVVRKLHEIHPEMGTVVYMYMPVPGSPMYDAELEAGLIYDYPTTLEGWVGFKLDSSTGWDSVRPWRGKDPMNNYRNREDVRIKSFFLWTGTLSTGFERNFNNNLTRRAFRWLRKRSNARLDRERFSLPWEWWMYRGYRRFSQNAMFRRMMS